MTWFGRSNRRLFLLLLALCAASFFATALQIYHFHQHRQEFNEEAEQRVMDQAKRAADDIGARLGDLKSWVAALRNDLASGAISPEAVPDRLRRDYHAHADSIFEIGVAFEPSAPCTPETMHAPHFGGQEDAPKAFLLEDYYPSPYTGYDWYQQLIKGGQWVEPYLGGATKTLVVGYGQRFYCEEPDKTCDGSEAECTPAGVVRINLALEDIRERLQGLDLGRTGFGYILSRKGVFIAHPISEYARGIRTIFDEIKDPARADGTDVSALTSYVGRVTAGEEGLLHTTDPKTARPLLLAYTPIPNTDWSLTAVFFEDEILQESPKATRDRLVWIGIAGIAFLFFLLLVLFGAYWGIDHRLWAGGGAVAAVLFTLGIIGIWYLALTFADARSSVEQTVLTSEAGVRKFLSDNRTRASKRYASYESPVYIPTGVFVQSIEFSTANNVVVTGYVWQKYGFDLPTDLSRGFVFPEAESVEITDAYTRSDGKSQVVGWYFKTVLRQSFDYAAYPLDHQNVWLRIWHSDFDKNVILTPDLEAYDFINPRLRPGLEQADFVLPAWNVEKTYFSYRENSYNTNFGIVEYVGQRGFPELYFNIALTRKFIGPFISNIIPLSAVSVMLFGVLMFGTKQADKVGLLGFSASTVLSICAAFFFTVVIAHVTLRASLAAPGIVYIEDFYFVLYLAILAVSLNAMFFAREDKVPLLQGFVQYRDNFWPKLLYWPLLTGLMLIITIGVFY